MKNVSQRCARFFGAASVLMLSSCGMWGPHNVIPNWQIQVEPAPSILEKVDEVALQAGLVLKPGPQWKTNFGDGPGVGLAYYSWPGHPSSGMALFKMLKTEEYRIVFSDNRIDGWYLVGPPCQEYLQLVGMLKTKLGNAALHIPNETCDPRADASGWKKFPD